MNKPTNRALYVLAAIIVILTLRTVHVYLGHFLEVRQERLEAERNAPQDPLHALLLNTQSTYFMDTNFIATLQVGNLGFEPIPANVSFSLYLDDVNTLAPVNFNIYGESASIIEFPLQDLYVGQHTLHINVESELGTELFTRPINIIQHTDSNIVVHFDKGLYNPGDEVLFRIMALQSATSRPIAHEEFTISIYDGNNNRVFVQDVFSSYFGIMSGSFRLADEVNSGMYRLSIAQDGHVLTNEIFEVSPFVLPRFEITLETCQPAYQTGETIHLTGTVMYFFGEPVNQGTVNVYVNDGHILYAELDEYGRFSLEHIAMITGSYNFWLEVIDNSNYRREATISVASAVGAFQIEIMPEFGHLIIGMPNYVHVFTHTAGGAPVRTFLQIRGSDFSLQVATDNDGMARFAIPSPTASTTITILAADMYNNEITQSFVLHGETQHVTLSTNKPRYSMGETIYLSLSRTRPGGIFRIYVYRNRQLLKVVESPYENAALNLGDEFGIIDIYAVLTYQNSASTPRGRYVARRTIFIDPGSYMLLTVQTDQPEYEPGQRVNLNFTATDNAGVPLTAALLVSIVDEAMLSLAANDLSIDNIRLALDGIYFSEDLDAATLYASLIANASEQAITRILLRQSSPQLRPAMIYSWTYHSPPAPFVSAIEVSSAEEMADVARIYLAVVCIAMFFGMLFQKRKTHEYSYLSSTYSPDIHQPNSNGPTPYATPILPKPISKAGRRRAVWVVFACIAIFILTIILLSACGSSDERATSDNATTAGTDSNDARWDMWQAPAAEVEFERNVASTPVPETSLDVADEAPQAADASAATEIETQTGRVRRLFLETMLFVPELIARDGHADLSFILADNITTWNIQVVGNTADGLVGHTQNSFRAFQPFFVDFELPRNSIRHDRVSIPVTVFNYTDYDQNVILTIADLDWFDLRTDAVHTIYVPSNRSHMIYIPITITQFGDFVFRVYADTIGFADAAERPIRVNPEGFRIRRVVSSGSIEGNTQLHLLYMQENIPDTRNAFITFYPSVMSSVIEGMENIFRMPFGCFEQTSSILYPNILALQYMQRTNKTDPVLTERALEFISSGYQRLLTFEVPGTNGGFSLFGSSPAETLLTAYGLMQLNELTNVYTIDQRVLARMAAFIFDNQNNDGSFNITGRNVHERSQQLAFSAYITWALSETFPHDARLTTSVNYLLSNLSAIDDNYTLALIANVLVNTNHSRAGEIVNELVNNISIIDGMAYVTSTSRDYFGAFGRMQYLQTTALTSIAISGYGSFQHQHTNNMLIDYIISRRDDWGTWHSTQATILSLKALIRHASEEPLASGQITVTVGNQVQHIDIDGQNTLGFYQVAFRNLAQENVIDIAFPDIGRMTFKVVQEFFAPYNSVQLDRGFEIIAQMDTDLAVHELATQNLRIINTSGDIIKNGLVAISIPQGFRVERNSLTMLQHQGLIQRYEMRHDNINLYLRDTLQGEIIDLTITYRPAFPVEVTGGHVRVFDYYNPMVEGYLMPVEILVR